MNVKNKKVFVSGAAGVIGIQLVKLLENEGCKVFAADLKDRPLDFSSKVFYRQGDLNFLSKFEIESYGCAIFFHLAASFERTFENLKFYKDNFSNNILLSNKLLKLFCDSSRIEKIIFASSYLVYDKSNYITDKNGIPRVLNENSSKDTRNLVGTAKYLHEKEVEFYKKFKKKIKFHNVRIFRGYGLGSRDVISRWIRSALNNQVIELYNLNSCFDFIFCTDSAKGLLEIAKNKNLSQTSINLGSSKAIKIIEIIKILKKFFKNLKIKNKSSDKLIEKSYSGNFFMKKIGWKPTVSIKQGVLSIINYEKKFLYSDKKKSENKKILITCFGLKKISWYTHLKFAAQRVDKNLKLIFGNSVNNIMIKSICGNMLRMPEIKNYKKLKILKILKQNRITIVIPTNNDELLFWSKYKSFFLANNIFVVVSPYNSVKKSIDKFKFFKFCNQHSIPTINTVNNLSDIKKLKSNSYVLKDNFGSGSKKIYKKIGLNHLTLLVEKTKNSNYIIQDFCDSKKEYSVDAWYSGDLRLSNFVVRERKYVDDGESKITTIVKKFKLTKQLERYLKKFRFYGPINFQFFLKNNSIIFIECNPRFGGASTFSIKSGLDLFYYSILNSYYKDSKYDKILLKKVYSIKKQIRLAVDIDENHYL